MSEMTQLLKIIEDVLQPGNTNLRKDAENLLITLRNEKPNELMKAYLDILSSNILIYSAPNKLEYRNFAASQLRLCLSNFAPATYTNLWAKLTPELQSLIKINLFQIIYAEQDAS